MKKRLLIAIYSHPEGYPPTLNALSELSGVFDHISVLYRPLLSTEWEYPGQVQLCPCGAEMSARQQEALPLLKRIRLFLQFALQLYRICKKEKPQVVLLYDALPVLAYGLVKMAGLHRHIVWYHNHDVLEPVQKTFSLNWWAYRAERILFSSLDIFSLPALERKAYFPMEKFNGRFFFLPNLPAVAFYRKYQAVKKDDHTWRLIFQGHLDRGHGIEEILDLMPAVVGGRPLRLILKGWIRDDYKAFLDKRIREKGLQNEVEFVGYTAYQELPKLTASCHIGIAIHAKTDIMNKTLGTASNKIYEYAAVGLPVLYYDNPHFSGHLGKFEWAFPTDLSPASLLNSIEQITGRFESLSSAARRDFSDELNFEHHFHQVSDHLDNMLSAGKQKMMEVTWEK